MVSFRVNGVWLVAQPEPSEGDANLAIMSVMPTVPVEKTWQMATSFSTLA
jgi:hypothetical protein